MGNISHISQHMTAPNQMEQEAQRLREFGYHPLPLDPVTKFPCVKWKKYQDEQPTAQRLHDWFKKFPSAGVCITPSNLIIIDIDGAANPWPAEPEQRMDLFAAPTVLTPGGGSHHWFKLPEGRNFKNSAGKLARQVDIRTYGGIAVCPPTSKANGRVYEWTNDDCVDVGPNMLGELPGWLLEQIDATHGHKTPVAESKPMAADIPEGSRNETLFRVAGYFRKAGSSEAVILATLTAKNAEMANPLPADQVAKIAASAASYEPDQATVAVVENWAGQDAEKAAPRAEHAPDDMLAIPGFVSDVMGLTLSTAPYPNKVMAFAGALSLQAMLAGRKVKTSSGLRTNFYIIALGESGVGKDWPRRVNRDIATEAGVRECLLGSAASGAGLEDQVFRQPSSLAQMDEIDEMMMSIRKDRTGTKQHLPKVMMEMFSTASSAYDMRAKAGRDDPIGCIEQPNLCVLGSAIPERFYESVSVRMLSDGFIGRSIILDAGARGDRQKAIDVTVPTHIAMRARWWSNQKPGGNLANVKPQPKTVAYRGHAEQMKEAAMDEFDNMRAACLETGDQVGMSIWARAGEHSEKLALIYAVSIDPDQPMITEGAVEWAANFMRQQAAWLIQSVRDHVAENEFHALTLRIKDLLRKNGGDMGHSLLLRRLKLSAREVAQAVDTMIVSAEIDVSDVPTSGRTGKVYSLARFSR